MKSMYDLPVEQRSSDVWDNWTVGIRQLSPVRAMVQSGHVLTLADLQTVHRGFYTLATEQGDFAWEPFPGVLKIASPVEGVWWTLSDDAAARARVTTQEINDDFKAMGLLPTPAAGQTDDDVLLVKITGNGVHSSSNMLLRTHIANMLNFLNTMLAQARQSQPMIWNGRVMSPMQLAFFVQQYDVDIHAFHEGNGRLSRFLQELVLTSFDLPEGASGDLMNDDTLTPHADYYKLAVAKTSQLLDQVQNECLKKQYKKASRDFNDDVHQVPAENLSYACRLVKD